MKKKDIAAMFRDGKEIDAALERAGRQALLLHKRAGQPVVVWRDGQVVWVPPEEIEVEEE